MLIVIVVYVHVQCMYNCSVVATYSVQANEVCSHADLAFLLPVRLIFKYFETINQWVEVTFNCYVVACGFVQASNVTLSTTVCSVAMVTCTCSYKYCILIV